MQYPNFGEEKKLWKQGIEVVVGLDEAGRGPLAGPVIAAAVTVQQIPNHKLQVPKVNDSKKLSEKKREELYEILTNHPAISWGIGIVSEKVIDKINILEASKLAMQKALKDLTVPKGDGRSFSGQASFLLIDGNFKIDTSRLRQGSGEPKQKSIIKGDQKVFSQLLPKLPEIELCKKCIKNTQIMGFIYIKAMARPYILKI